MDNATRSQIQLPSHDTHIEAQAVHETHGTLAQSVVNVSPFSHNHGENTPDNTILDKQEEPNVDLPSARAHGTPRTDSSALLKGEIQAVSGSLHKH
jgi:hypothetical protein